MNSKNPKVDFYFDKDNKWKEGISKLRKLILGCGLSEELKWGVPCYALQKSNIVLIHVFKEYFALLFFKGALLHNEDGMLIQQTENTQATRQIRFTHVNEVIEKEAILKAYVFEAIAVEKAGLKVPLKKTAAFAVPEEFQQKLNESAIFKTAFEALTPGRQRAYLLYFANAKQSATRASRIEKYRQQILNGKGLNDE
ncbi:MAG: YdeI/OmpD-associated family protein [Pelobium sp.]